MCFQCQLGGPFDAVLAAFRWMVDCDAVASQEPLQRLVRLLGKGDPNRDIAALMGCSRFAGLCLREFEVFIAASDRKRNFPIEERINVFKGRFHRIYNSIQLSPD